MTALKRVRLASGLSVAQAARAVGITPSYLSALERRGSSALSWNRAVRLAQIYQTSISTLIGGPEGAVGHRNSCPQGSQTKRKQIGVETYPAGNDMRQVTCPQALGTRRKLK